MMPLRPYHDVMPALGNHCYVADSAELIGKLTVGDDSSFWPQVVVRGDVNVIAIGARTNVQDGAVLHVSHDHDAQPGGFPLLIGDEVTIGHKAILHGCTIGQRCLIGMGSVVLDGAILEDGVMLGAGSLVPPHKRLEGGFLWLGQPARRIRPLTEAERAHLAYSAAHYVRLKDEYLLHTN